MAMTARQRSRISKSAQIALFVAVILALVLSVDWATFGKTFFDLPGVKEMFPDVILIGLRNTLLYTVLAFAFGLVAGLVLALMRQASFAPYRWVSTFIVEFFRGVPALLVLLAFGFGLPAAFGYSWPQWLNITVGLGLVSAAYIAETLRAGLQAVPKGQYEAARSMGMSGPRAMVTIVIPQAFRIVLPPLTNEVILLAKDSSLVYVLGMLPTQFELTKFANDGINQYAAGLTPLVVAAGFYLLITIPLTLLSRWLERRTGATSRPRKGSSKPSAPGTTAPKPSADQPTTTGQEASA